MSSATTIPGLTMTDELAKIIAEATDTQTITSAVQAELAKQLTAAQEKTDADAKAAADAAAKTTKDAAAATTTNTIAIPESTSNLITRVENIGGQDMEFSGKDDAEIDRLVLNAYKVAFAVRKDSVAEPPVDPAVAAKAAADAAAAKEAAKAELELKFKRGEIPVSDYIKQSGAMDEYLASQGIALEDLKESVEKVRNEKDVQSWESATQAFLQGPGADWPGGEVNKTILGLKIAELDLTNATDKVAALTAAYASMKQNKQVFPVEVTKTATEPNAADVAAKAAADAAAKVAADAAAVKATADAAAALAATPAQRAASSSGVFGASSGVGAGPSSGASEVKAAIDIPKDATGDEIMALWKQAALREGKDPNAEFNRMFAARGRS
jgi:hypothetical protein